MNEIVKVNKDRTQLLKKVDLQEKVLADKGERIERIGTKLDAAKVEI